ncbi:MAG: M56 family metallopeptidase [Marinilabiliaceae bacterium]|nr:M56 family metallopeptidase [Marinilabiliaceae bacterium]
MNFIEFILKSSLIVAFLWIIYHFLMRKEPYLLFNRWVLLGIILFCIILPNVQLPVLPPVMVETATITEIKIDETLEILAETNQTSFSWVLLFYITYFIGMGYFLIRFFKRMYIIRNRIAKNSFMNTENITAFTFFRKIYIDRSKFSDDDYETILWHEQAHARQLHSLDLVLAELLIILQWFNPFVWKLKKSLAELHEYLADRHVVAQGVPIEQYKQLLYNQATGVYPEYANAFSYSLIKKRLIMVSKIKNGNRAALKICCLIFAMVMTVAWSCFTNSKQETPETDPVSVEVPDENLAEIETEIEQEELYDEELAKDALAVVDKSPQFPGGEIALLKFIADEVKYPDEAKEKGIEGRVMVQFIVDAEGDVRNVKVMRKVHPLLDKEAVRAINVLPKWIPGEQNGKPVNVYYTIPINFTLQKEAKEE